MKGCFNPLKSGHWVYIPNVKRAYYQDLVSIPLNRVIGFIYMVGASNWADIDKFQSP